MDILKEFSRVKINPPVKTRRLCEYIDACNVKGDILNEVNRLIQIANSTKTTEMFKEINNDITKLSSFLGTLVLQYKVVEILSPHIQKKTHGLNNEIRSYFNLEVGEDDVIVSALNDTASLAVQAYVEGTEDINYDDCITVASTTMRAMGDYYAVTSTTSGAAEGGAAGAVIKKGIDEAAEPLARMVCKRIF
ncbi:hypothetical protein [Bacillus cereus]|uniref:hypothetical protein n=1 Tax=Bacillus cereus TaxID=1396 RepID=UPI000BEE11D4|nr:hypothetical protein [Bacillus cereus]PDZ79403.1 hypothetical protein CON31_12210 [Bacillus cereus]PFB33613.1 hypothetical protein CN392_17720 [Bacillus cereus]PFO32886.1 hypothetical protein COJ82_27810 [Bacillus cereus]PFQ34287.1 hypothetical protein COK33_20350 [Bacillus cereus]PGR20167.1 hypothetical protein COA25_08620 [Bacillus cereus]